MIGVGLDPGWPRPRAAGVARLQMTSWRTLWRSSRKRRLTYLGHLRVRAECGARCAMACWLERGSLTSRALGFEAIPRFPMPEGYGPPPASSVTSIISRPVSATLACPAGIDGVRLGPTTSPSPPRK